MFGHGLDKSESVKVLPDGKGNTIDQSPPASSPVMKSHRLLTTFVWTIGVSSCDSQDIIIKIDMTMYIRYFISLQ